MNTFSREALRPIGAAGIRQPVYDGRKIPLKPRPKQRLHFSGGFRERVRELAKRFRTRAGREMVDLMRRIRFLMQRDDRFGDIVHRDDIDPIGRAKRQNRQAREKHERANHVELRRFGAAAVAEHDARTKHGSRNVGEQFPHHVLAEFFRARVRVVVGAVPVDGSVFGHHFVAALARDGDGGNLAEAAQAVRILRAARELRDFQSAAQIHVEAAFFGFAIERSRAMNHRLGRADQVRVVSSRPAQNAAR